MRNTSKDSTGIIVNYRSIIRKLWKPYFFIAPSLILILVLYVVPIKDVIYFSFHKVHTILGVEGYNGIQNFVKMFDPSFINILWRTFAWICISSPLALIIGFFLALLLNKDMPGKKLFRALVIVPWAIPHSIVAVFWSWFVHHQYGYLNAILIQLGLVDRGITFLSVNMAFCTIIAMRVWKTAPFAALNILAALQTIPEEVYDAAKVDGAEGWRFLLNVILPQIKGTIITIALITTIWAATTFDMIWVLTEGGPLGSTEILPLTIYKQAFFSYDAGVASAGAIMNIVLILSVTILYWRTTLKKGDAA